MLFFTLVLPPHRVVVLLYGALQKQKSKWEVMGENNLRAIKKKKKKQLALAINFNLHWKEFESVWRKSTVFKKKKEV